MPEKLKLGKFLLYIVFFFFFYQSSINFFLTSIFSGCIVAAFLHFVAKYESLITFRSVPILSLRE